LCLSIKAFYAFANLCAAARRRPNGTAARRFPLVPANAGAQSGFPRAREMSERSPDCATRNPGLTAIACPGFRFTQSGLRLLIPANQRCQNETPYRRSRSSHRRRLTASPLSEFRDKPQMSLCSSGLGLLSKL
jgi:hypothetical protein